MEADRLGCRKVAVILDTNTLLLMAGGLVSPEMLYSVVESGADLIVPSQVLEELRSILSRGGLRGKRARLALEIAGRLGAREAPVPLEGSADRAVEALARELLGRGCRVMVATSDRSLRRRLRRAGVPTVYYRASEGRLEADWLPI